jgi:hypothetical protein
MAEETEKEKKTYTLNQIAIILIGSIVITGLVSYGIASLINKSKK